MILYLEAKTNIKDVFIESIEVKLNNNEIVYLTWDESHISREKDTFSAKYKGVYFNDDYANEKIDLLKGAYITYVELYYEEEYESPYLVLKDMFFEDGNNELDFDTKNFIVDECDNV